jgi:hypothetical protein
MEPSPVVLHSPISLGFNIHGSGGRSDDKALLSFLPNNAIDDERGIR